ncbi:hypothetical protein [Pseudomonas denitrificans (nom. rej.)]|uniref:Uncharacterized protein n=1 Tax=Pseudomonas denitrificans TaxID=43306 RepID=A0A9X7R769_PSEDE|nr:hypothetical protein [Pseudomonas denitrificans (nom. rej.)]QEY75157.1 hypothetical protein F1C79_27980 [Pseudomonas denitrificans (nom. rej.)]
MSLADERRTIAGGITAARKSQQLVSDLQSLESQRRKIGELNELERRGARPATPGRAVYKAPAATGTGGVASPLIEQSYLERTYWPDKVITSTDGVFSFKIKPIKQIRQLDANDAEVIQQFAQPEEAP